MACVEKAGELLTQVRSWQHHCCPHNRVCVFSPSPLLLAARCRSPAFAGSGDVTDASECIPRRTDGQGVEAFTAPVPGALPLLVALPTSDGGEDGGGEPAPAGALGRSGGSLQGYRNE